MRKSIVVGALLMALFSVFAIAQTPAAAAKTDAPAASQGKELYSKTLFDYLLKQRTAQGAPDTPDLRESIREELNTREVLIKAAKAAKTESKENIKLEMDLSSQMVLIRAYLSDWLEKNPVPEDLLKKEYEALKEQLGDKEYQVAHILVETEGEAKDIVKDLQGGKKFADIAKEKSKDPGSKEKGGELGWNTPGTFVKPFADALPTIEKGKFSAMPVQTQYGWHVIKIDDVRATKLPPYEELKPQLQQRAQAVWLEQHFKNLREKAGV
ncbi:MAG: peptidylprolyl isomerase [Burkholderiales bacterium]|nr:peptidylprolyl isomerase [Burkholderiales bacterium]